MSQLWAFLSRTQGRRGPNLTDYAAYAYLMLGLLVILLPVLWLGLNSLKSRTLLDQNDISLLPQDFARLGRASVTGPEGKDFVLIDGLPDWVLNWAGLSADERALRDAQGFAAGYVGNERRVLESHLGLTAAAARALILERGLDACLLVYPTALPDVQAACDVAGALASLPEGQRVSLGTFLGLPAYQIGKLSGQIRVTAPDPETGIDRVWGVSRLSSPNGFLPARPLDDPSARPTPLPQESVRAQPFLDLRLTNYTDPLRGDVQGVDVNFVQCFTNSVIVTVFATLLTLLVNAMAAFALSKYRFRGQVFTLALVLGTLMVPPAVMMIGVFQMIQFTGLGGSIWGVIIPGAATPTGVFLLRQYMLTIPEELLEAARMDAATEWKVFWRLVVPLAMPAIAALGILSVIWRWNDLILPLIAIPFQTEAHTLQLCLLNLNGENVGKPHYKLAMTMLTLVPVTLVFVFLQRFITTGVAATGVK